MRICTRIRSFSVELDRGDDSPIAATYIFVEDGDQALPTSGLEKTGNREYDSVEHSVRKADIPVAEILLFGLKVL